LYVFGFFFGVLNWL